MTDWKVPALTLAATALAVASTLAPPPKVSKAEVAHGVQIAAMPNAAMPQQSTASSQSDLFDPRLVAGTICRGKAAREAFSRGAPQSAQVQLAGLKIAEAAKADGPAMPLLDGLGDLSIKITTGNALAQRYFDQGLRLAYGFNHADAIRSFKQAQKIDPGCALCYWGEAWALGPNVNVPMQPEAEQLASNAVTLARSLALQTSEKEQALIAALDQRYFDTSDSDPSDQEDPGRSILDRNFANAMAGVHRRFPDDDDIAVIYAEAMMNLSPWDYWEADAKTPKGRTFEVVSLLEKVLNRNPNHAAAIHLYIHIVEASNTPERAEKHADRLGALMPAAGHIVHMPSHIYYRIGRYIDSVRVNQAAIEADELLFDQLKSSGVYPLVYYPHNVHFVMTSAQMAGADETVLKAARKLDAVLPMAAAQAIPLVQPIKAAPIFALAQFGSRDEILAIPNPGNDVPFIKAMWHYARGSAFAKSGELAAARAEAAAIEEINAKTDLTSLIEAAVPGPEVIALSRHVLLGRIAQAEGNYEEAIGEFSAAVEIQSNLPYMEPPYWYYPVNQSLGAVLLQSERLDDAERAFKAALFEAPNNGWAIYGLIETYRAMGDAQGVKEMQRLFKAAWAGNANSLSLAKL
ncbi:lipopolysaccharide assembly protein LapB [Pelagibius sp. Alg239-R121]|uniref:tetratricopeptide repeat protein n=1 Tax=Pelagibius sp. Alg239-R121 TaxID=2993448 RepID=UPI0024A63D2D|nr:tetratricopeptide repeat protein [Pelagibius sp. Alg239-R121]